MNPFIKKFPLKVVKVDETTFKIGTTQYPKDGIITDMTSVDEVKRTYLAEQRRKSSIYQNPYRVELINALTPSGIKLYLWLVMHLERDNDTIEMNHAKVGKALKFSSTRTFYNAVNNLIDLEIIAKKAANEYWINPHYAFNGDRIKYYKKHSDIEVVANRKSIKY